MPDTATVAAETGRALLGREDEQQAIDRLLERVRSGRGGVLVVRGEAGVGKTSLLDYLAARPIGTSSALPCSGWSRSSRRPAHRSAWSTTRSGSIGRPLRRSDSSPGGWWASRS